MKGPRCCLGISRACSYDAGPYTAQEHKTSRTAKQPRLRPKWASPRRTHIQAVKVSLPIHPLQPHHPSTKGPGDINTLFRDSKTCLRSSKSTALPTTFSSSLPSQRWQKTVKVLEPGRRLALSVLCFFLLCSFSYSQGCSQACSIDATRWRRA